MKIIIGIGNPLRADDGIGPRIIELLLNQKQALLNHEKNFGKNYEKNPKLAQYQSIKFLDIGGNIWELQNYLNKESEQILIIDSAQIGAVPGEYQIYTLDYIIKQTLNNTTPHLIASPQPIGHESDLWLLIRLYQKAEYYLPPISIMAIQPENTGFGATLSESLERQLENYANRAMQFFDSDLLTP